MARKRTILAVGVVALIALAAVPVVAWREHELVQRRQSHHRAR